MSRPMAHRSFDPQIVGRLESQAWVAYYRRRWLHFLRVGDRGRPADVRALVARDAAVLMAHPRAPTSCGRRFPTTTPRLPFGLMERFYRIVQAWTAEPFDPALAAELELQWWTVHRRNQHAGDGSHDVALADALARLYAHVYGVSERLVRPAAEQRALAMRHSDRWVSSGCPPASALIEQERAALIRHTPRSVSRYSGYDENETAIRQNYRKSVQSSDI